MNIFINGLSARLGGGQTYLMNLLKHVPEDLQVFVLVQPGFNLDVLPLNVVRIEKSHLENPFVRKIWEETALPRLLRQLKIDLFFSPGGLLPESLPKGMLTAVTFQNMLPFDHVQRAKYAYGYRWLRDWLLERGLSNAMKKANLVIYISEFARNFIERNLGKMPGRTVVIPHGLHSAFKVSKQGGRPRPTWFPDEDCFLYVSFIDFYKAQIEIVLGFAEYLRHGGTGCLLLVGAEYRPYGAMLRKKIADLGLQGYVKLVGNVPHHELPAAYQHAKVNIFASYTENCPNILLEMMASGRPALVSNRGPMTEFGKDAVEYFDPSKPQEFASKLTQLMADEVRQCQLALAAQQQVEGFTWECAAKSTWGAISEFRMHKPGKIQVTV